MNKHVFYDTLTAQIGALLSGKKKFFSKRCTSPSFKELTDAIEIDLPTIASEGSFEINAKTPLGTLHPAYRVEKWLGTNYPTIIYHHGNNERPFDYGKSAKNTFYHIFVKTKELFDANLIVVRAPFHNISLKEYQSKITDLENFMTMISTSVKINEAIISAIHKTNKKEIITSGISLGGWVTNLHRSFFNTSDLYVPLLAGSYLAELFLQSKYKKLTGNYALQKPELLREKLNFNSDFEKVTTQNVYPLLARYDQFIEYEIQTESYQNHPIHTIECGHITGAINSEALRKHFSYILQKISTSK